MIEQERLVPYLNSLEQPESALLSGIRREAVADGVPIIREETAALLRFFVRERRPARILEVGTAVGYSALVMAEQMPEACTITTMEKYEKRIPEAKKNFAASEYEDRIRFLTGDATEILQQLPEMEKYDFLFMDAAKAQYLSWLPLLLRVAAPHALILSDNVLQDGDVVESRFAVTRRNRTIHRRMRDYLYTLKHTEGLSSLILPVGDGVALTTVLDAAHAVQELECANQSDETIGIEQ